MGIAKKEVYVCPKCGSYMSMIKDYEFDVDCLWLRMECQDCEEEWSEYAILQYDGCSYNGHMYDKDGKEND